MKEKELCRTALMAMNGAYAPYSDCLVGAALLTGSGRIYTGCNIENASFTPTVCAERVAFFKAVSEGESEFEMIAVVGGKNGKVEKAFTPCGVCRQVMSEFCHPDFKILVMTDENNYEKYTLSQLLPHSFSSENL